MDGIILFNKPKDWTSQDVCTKIKHLLKVKKIGHCGTLDPFATGLLVILINEATKIGQFIESFDKIYIARLKLGEKTTTGDLKGDVVETSKVKKLTKEDIEIVFKSLIGKQEQLPPMYSAIKVDGLPLYKYAREGIEVKRKPKEIEVFDIQLLNFDQNTITFMCHVSKGTYIRTLGELIAERLDTVGHLLDLQRIKVGNYLLNNACDFNTLDESKIIPFHECLKFMKCVYVDEMIQNKIKNGQKIFLNVDEKIVAVFNRNKTLLAIYEKDEGNRYKVLRGFSNASN